MSTSIFDWFSLMAQNMGLYVGVFMLVLGILVFVHEWGHYIVARMCGVKVDSFSVGFGKELFGITDKNGTRWKFSLIPLGGYVKMFGDTDPASAGHTDGVEEGEEVRPMTEEEKKVAFFTQPLWQRALIVFAGPAINFILAIIIFTAVYAFIGKVVTPPRAAAVMVDSAAYKAGFLPHDEVVAIDGKPITRFEEIRREVMIGLDQERIFTVRRNGVDIDLRATPEKLVEEDRFGFVHQKGLLGLISQGSMLDINKIVAVEGVELEMADDIRSELLAQMGNTIRVKLDRGEQVDELLIHPIMEFNEALTKPENEEYDMLNVSAFENEVFVKYGPIESFVESMNETSEITVSTLKALWQMVTGTRSATELGGIIRIGAIAGDMAKSGILAVIMFTALLSINLGLINLFPIPMLDGGHLLFYAVEAVKGAPISEQIQEYAFRLGFAVLIAIMLFANLNDIAQLIQ